METNVMSLIASGVRKIGESNLTTVSFNQLVEQIKATSFSVVRSNAGKQFVHVKNATDYITIGVSDKVAIPEDVTDTLLIPYLVANMAIYAGVGDNGSWFTFGPKGASREPVVEVTAEQLAVMLKEKGLTFA